MATEALKPATEQAVKKVAEDIQPVPAFLTKCNNDWIFTFAAALAYNLLTAMFPLAVALLSITGIFLGNLNPQAQQHLISQIGALFPPSISTQDLINTIVHQLPNASGLLGIIALVSAIFFGSRLFIAIEGCFNIIYHVKPRSIISQNIMAIGMLLLFVILIPIMLVASSVPALVLSLLSTTALHNLPGSNWIFSLGGILGSLLVSFILFLAIYTVVPNEQISLRRSWLGALVAAVALQIYLILFPLYTTYFIRGYVGQVGFAIILLIFFYYFALILLLGAEFNAFFLEKVQATPHDLATMVHNLTSHSPKSPQEQETQAAESHKDIRHTQGKTATGTPPTASQDQTDVVEQEPSEHAKDARKYLPSKKERSRPRSQIAVTLQAMTGVALAVIIELIRLRRSK